MATTVDTQAAGVPRVEVERWPTEIPLLVLVILASLGFWALLAISLIGIVYAAIIGVALFAAHVSLIAYVRGNGVRLGPEQFPEIHARVQALAREAGLRDVPEAYILQHGGALNAFATRLFRSRILVLFSDLLEACGSNSSARDMVIGHELGHVRAGHLSFQWLVVPGMLMPFLGQAYSRAREYTCDRWGAALCGDRQAALTGLAILAAGGEHGPKVNLRSLAGQRQGLDTGLMTLGTWLATHPPLCERVVALEPGLGEGQGPFRRGPVRALGTLAIVMLVPAVLAVAAMAMVWPRMKAAIGQAQARAFEQQSALSPGPVSTTPLPALTASEVAAARATAEADMRRLQAVAEESEARLGTLPADDDALRSAWRLLRPGQELPLDPFDGKRYGYSIEDGQYTLWSAGPDRESNTEDDIYLSGSARETADAERR